MKKIKIGTIVTTHGLRGELKIKSFSDFDEIRYQKGKQLFIQYHEEFLPVEVVKFRIHKGMVLAAFSGLENINAVEKFRNCDIYMNQEDRHELEDNEVYFADLKCCEVYFDDGSFLGEVEEVMETGANAVLRVKQKILIPFVAAFIKECDIEKKKIVVKKVDGLL